MTLIKPHGGKLIERVLNKKEIEKLSEEAKEYPKIEIELDDILEIYNIATGAFSPLEGFMNENDYFSVLREGRLSNGIIFPIPIILPISKKELENVKTGEEVLLTDHKQNLVGLITIEDKYEYNKEELAKKVFKTTERKHAGVDHYHKKHDFAVGGKIKLIDIPGKEEMFLETDKTPKEVRKIISKRGWKTCVGFQTRNVPHRAHEYLQKAALEMFDGILIHPLVGKKKKGDFKPHAIIQGYETLIKNYYNPNRVIFSTITTLMRYAGPREAVFHSILRQNFGCTHFIIGRDHAGVGGYYGKYDAHKIFEQFSDLKITPVRLNGPRYCYKCESITTEKTCPHDKENIKEISGTEIRTLVLENKQIPKELMREEVSKILKKEDILQ